MARSKVSKTTEDAFFEERGFGLTMGFGERPALIVVDFAYGFTDPSQLLGSDLTKQIKEANRVIDLAHQRGIPVLYSTVEYDDNELDGTHIWTLKQKGSATLKKGTRNVRLDRRVHRNPDDPVIVKKYASVFFGTDLVPRLTTSHIDTLVIVGCSTSGCIRATAVDASQNGFRPMVVREAVGDRSPAAHEQSLFDLHSRYADVVGINEVLAYFRTRKKPARAAAKKTAAKPKRARATA